MSRTKLVMLVAGAAAAAGAAGCAFGMLSAPASGKELRRRLAWRAEQQWRGAARASRHFIRRAVDRAVAELESRRKGVTV